MIEALSVTEIEEKLKDLDGWGYSDDKIFRQFEFENFREAVSFIVKVGFEAEELEHHPNIFNVYNRVEIALQTHDAGDKVTEKDFDLARAIQAL